MSIDLLPALLGLSLLDSVNPSALVVALWLLSRPHAASRLLAYVGGILIAYLGLGVAMMLGFGALRDALGDSLDHPAALIAQGVLGAGLLAYGIFAPKSALQAPEPHAPARGRLVGYVVLGMTVTAVELVTALPYFAAIALMLGADLAPLQWLPLLLAYNAIFIAPPLLLLALHALLGSRSDERFARWRQRLQRGARETALWVFALVGVALIGDAVERHIEAGKATHDADDVTAMP
jgi:cytochrome c biogenesis protein CcdA